MLLHTASPLVSIFKNDSNIITETTVHIIEDTPVQNKYNLQNSTIPAHCWPDIRTESHKYKDEERADLQLSLNLNSNFSYHHMYDDMSNTGDYNEWNTLTIPNTCYTWMAIKQHRKTDDPRGHISIDEFTMMDEVDMKGREINILAQMQSKH